MENKMDPPAIYWTRPVTCICLCSALDNSLGLLARESPCTIIGIGALSQAQLVNMLFYLQGVAYKWLHVSALFSRPSSGCMSCSGDLHYRWANTTST